MMIHDDNQIQTAQILAHVHATQNASGPISSPHFEQVFITVFVLGVNH